jgi:hypothetical protein
LFRIDSDNDSLRDVHALYTTNWRRAQQVNASVNQQQHDGSGLASGNGTAYSSANNNASGGRGLSIGAMCGIVAGIVAVTVSKNSVILYGINLLNSFL